MNKNIAIGTDIGGSHISCAAIDLVSGKILRDTLTERQVDNQAQAEVIIGTWTQALSDVLAKVKVENVKGIGFAMPGPFDYVKGICYIRGVAEHGILMASTLPTPFSEPIWVFMMVFLSDL